MPNIFTKTGDHGQTSLFNGVRVNKNNIRVESYGKIDELVSCLGLATTFLNNDFIDLKADLINIQKDLFNIGFELANPDYDVKKRNSINELSIKSLENKIIEFENTLPPLKNFILPGKSKEASFLHVCRTNTRNLERNLFSLKQSENLRPEILIYINRLSDYLFMAARFVNFKLKIDEEVI